MNHFVDRLQKILSISVVSLAILSLLICIFFPIYTDEILWKVIQARYWADGNQALAQSIFPTCGSYAYAVPNLLLPYRLLNTFIDNQLTNPLMLRLWGISIGLIWLWVTWRLFRYVTHKQIKNSTIALCLIGFATLGVMPFLLILNRPEQLLLLCITVFFIPLLNENSEKNQTIYQSCIFAIGIFLLSSYMMTIHPKALFALPLVLLCIYHFVRQRWIALSCAIAILYFSAVAYLDWSLRWSCPKDPVIAATLRNYNLGSISNIAQLKGYFSLLMQMLYSTNAWYLNSVIPKTSYVSNMIPPFNNAVALLFGQILQLFFIYTFVAAFLIFIFSFFKNWSNSKHRVSHTAIATILLFFLASVVTRLSKNDYEATLIIPLLAFAVAGTLWVARDFLKKFLGHQNFLNYLRYFFIGLLSLSVLSQIAFITNFFPYTITTWKNPGYFAAQHTSVSNFGYAKLRPQIIEAAARCGIRPGDQPRHLVVDELTYYAFRDSYQPFFMSYLDEHSWCRHRPDPTSLLTEYHSAGMIVGCQWIPSALQNKAVHHGQFCCLPAFS